MCSVDVCWSTCLFLSLFRHHTGRGWREREIFTKGAGERRWEWVRVFSLALFNIRYPQIHQDNALNNKTIVRYLASLENILFHNVLKLHAKEASTFIYPFLPPPPPPPPPPSPSLGFYISLIAAIESGRNLIGKWYEFSRNSQWSELTL